MKTKLNKTNLKKTKNQNQNQIFSNNQSLNNNNKLNKPPQN